MRRSSSALSLDALLADMAADIELAAGVDVQPDEAPLWAPLSPQPGRGLALPDGRVLSPQQLAYETPADETGFGGGPGGGKSDLALGLAVTRHKSSAIFRRQFAQFRGPEGLMARARDIIGLRGREANNTWRGLPGGRAIEFLGCDYEKDVRKYLGRPHDLKCVAPDTPVLMGDGSYKAAVDLRVGDIVQTLEGPQPVTRTMRQRRHAVRLDLLGRDGRVVWSQVQAADHEVMVRGGQWASHDTWFAAGRSQTAASLSTGTRDVGRWPGWFGLRDVAGRLETSLLRLLTRPPSGQHQGCLPADAPGRSGSVVASGEPGPGTGYGASARLRGGAWLRSLWTGTRARRPLARASAAPSFVLGRRRRGGADDRRSASRAGSPERYSSGSRRRDERSRPWRLAVQVLILRPGDAAPRTPRGWLDDVLGQTRGRIRRARQYVHPYTRERRPTSALVACMAARSSSVGERDLVDVTVASCRHYITGPGVVNRNCFDEATEMPESYFRRLIGWLRTAQVGQRTRVVATFNPPTTEEGQWVIRYWGPWLDPTHPNPARPGELRWFVVGEDGKDREVLGPKWGRERAPAVQVGVHEDGSPRMVNPRSRTFVPSAVEDNPFYMATGYADQLDALPEPLRSMMRTGNFRVAVTDHERQVIPTEWVLAAQRRWRPDGWAGVPLSQVGADVSRGGAGDEFAIALRHEAWVAPLVILDEARVDGPTGAAHLARLAGPDVPVQIDADGLGFSVYDQARLLKLRAVELHGSLPTKARAKTVDGRPSRLGFANKRAEWHWRMRELLDPAGGLDLALPPDPQLRADLCAPRYEMTVRGIRVEPKEEITKRLGRSPDRGEAAIYACVPASAQAAQGLLFAAPAGSDAALDDELAALQAQLGTARNTD